MPRPSKWNSPTAAARFPAHAMPMLEVLARQLDVGHVQNPNQFLASLGLPQCPLLAGVAIGAPVGEGTLGIHPTKGYALVERADGSEQVFNRAMARSSVQNALLLFSVGEKRYLLRDEVGENAAVDAAVDAAWAELATLKPDERWWVLGRLVETWGTPIGVADEETSLT